MALLRRVNRHRHAVPRGMREIAAFKPMKEFLNQNPQKGLRLMLRPDTPRSVA